MFVWVTGGGFVCFVDEKIDDGSRSVVIIAMG